MDDQLAGVLATLGKRVVREHSSRDRDCPPFRGYMQYVLKRDDMKLDWFSGTGAGGQHRNKHQNCLRMTHLPSGVTVTAQTNRDRTSNLKEAYLKLQPLVANWLMKDRVKPERVDEVIRSYKLEDNLVIDHILGRSEIVLNLDDFDLDDFLIEKLALNKISG